jgi:hypothetical protein
MLCYVIGFTFATRRGSAIRRCFHALFPDMARRAGLPSYLNEQLNIDSHERKSYCHMTGGRAFRSNSSVPALP